MLSLLLISGSVFASQDIEIVGSIKQPIKVPASRTNSLQAQAKAPVITLLKIQLSDKARQTFAVRVNNAVGQDANVPAESDGKGVQLGMNGVPVLNQGQHGTCATFANTAAIDAALGHTDYISQLCLLQLGRHLENAGYTPSGWDGSLGRIILNQMDVFGIVSKANQKKLGCGGLVDYPATGSDPRGEISAAEYHKMSEQIPQDKILWSPILDIYQAVIDKADTNETINNIKKSLDAKDRVTFGVLLVDYDQGVVGAVGKHTAANDTWVLTEKMAQDLAAGADLAGHEMVITGYDDTAQAIDDTGVSHYGLFTLRNSWGPGIGDEGDFYMSYDYVKALIIEAQRIRDVSNLTN